MEEDCCACRFAVCSCNYVYFLFLSYLPALWSGTSITPFLQQLEIDFMAYDLALKFSSPFSELPFWSVEMWVSWCCKLCTNGDDGLMDMETGFATVFAGILLHVHSPSRAGLDEPLLVLQNCLRRRESLITEQKGMKATWCAFLEMIGTVRLNRWDFFLGPGSPMSLSYLACRYLHCKIYSALPPAISALPTVVTKWSAQARQLAAWVCCSRADLLVSWNGSQRFSGSRLLTIPAHDVQTGPLRLSRPPGPCCIVHYMVTFLLGGSRGSSLPYITTLL